MNTFNCDALPVQCNLLDLRKKQLVLAPKWWKEGKVFGINLSLWHKVCTRQQSSISHSLGRRDDVRRVWVSRRLRQLWPGTLQLYTPVSTLHAEQCSDVSRFISSCGDCDLSSQLSLFYYRLYARITLHIWHLAPTIIFTWNTKKSWWNEHLVVGMLWFVHTRCLLLTQTRSSSRIW